MDSATQKVIALFHMRCNFRPTQWSAKWFYNFMILRHQLRFLKMAPEGVSNQYTQFIYSARAPF